MQVRRMMIKKNEKKKTKSTKIFGLSGKNGNENHTLPAEKKNNVEKQKC